MTRLLGRIMTVAAAVMIVFAAVGCRTTKKTEVNDRLLGGTEVKEKTVTEFGGKATVTEKKTDYNAKGEKEKTETKTTGDTGSP